MNYVWGCLSAIFTPSNALAFITEIFGALLGVAGGIWIGGHEDRKRRKQEKDEEKEKRTSLICALDKELNDIGKELKVRTDSDDYYFYSIPTWNMALQSGAINILGTQEYFDYLEVYSLILYAQELEQQWVQSKLSASTETFRADYEKTMNDERKEIVKKIEHEIDDKVGR